MDEVLIALNNDNLPVPLELNNLPVLADLDGDESESDNEQEGEEEEEEEEAPYSPLHDAAMKGKLGVVKALVREGYDINEVDDDDKTPLYLAFENQHAHVASYLLKNGAATTAICDEDSNLLHLAVESGRINVARMLIQLGVDVNGRSSDGATPLHAAAASCMSRCTKLLVEYAADVNLRGASFEGYPVHEAASRMSTESIEILVRAGARLDVVDANGATPFHVAALLGFDIFDHKLCQGFDINCRSGNGATPLVLAAESGHICTVESLLKSGADVGVRTNNGFDALHLTCLQGHSEIASLLLQHGADPNTVNDENKHILQSTVEINGIECTRLLLDAGSKINASSESLIRLACSNLYWEIAEVLIEKGDKKSRDMYGTPLLMLAASNSVFFEKLLDEYGFDPTETDAWGTSPLHVAAAVDNCYLINLLLGRNADINCRNDRGSTPLHIAVCGVLEDLEYGTGEPNFYVVRTLLEAGADVEAKDSSGGTPLLYSASRNNCNVVRLLVEKGAEVNVRDAENHFPLYEASQSNQPQVVQVLLEAGAVVDMVEFGENRTALMIAAQLGHISVCQTLLSWTGNDKSLIDLPDKNGVTALGFASRAGELEVVTMLLSAGADPNSKDTKKGGAPIFYAVDGNHPEVVSLLLNNNAKRDAQAFDGDTPLKCAAVRGHTDCAKLLIPACESAGSEDAHSGSENSEENA